MNITLAQAKICVIGLGYVGLPLAVAFSARYHTVGFDKNPKRIAELQAGRDLTLEVSEEELAAASRLQYTDKLDDIRDCNIYIVAVPTPIDDAKRPDFRPLVSASTVAGQVLAPGNLVIYESTVYPGATEEVCVPLLEKESGLCYNRDFYCGYSPERINPGDKEHRLSSIVKVTSGSSPEAARFVDDLYASIIEAGTFLASSIRVAEAAKVIENTQRDVNIALINELSMIFDHLGINTREVLAAAGTKWNFLPFTPGLVGGHCIGVDPYYLTHKAQQVGYHPEMILAGRRINDGMGSHIAARVVKLMVQNGIATAGAKVLIMGLTFKENCPDLRNTRVIDIVRELKEYRIQVDIYDPWCSKEEAEEEYGLTLIDTLKQGRYSGVVVAVAHRQFAAMDVAELRSLGTTSAVLFDVKGIYDPSLVDGYL